MLPFDPKDDHKPSSGLVPVGHRLGYYGTFPVHAGVSNLRVPNLWRNLAGPPVRHSKAIDVRDQSHRRRHEGFIKLRLGHSEGRSYLIPDALFAVAGTRFYLPSFFSPPVFAFNIEDGKHFVSFSLDAGPPRATEAARLLVSVNSDDHILSYDDGAQLYGCSFEGPRTIARFATGLCRRLDDGDFALGLFHHTTHGTAVKIRASGELWSSPWNLAGTRELANIAYSYFTPLPRIETEADLHRIAMASNGTIHLQTTSSRSREDVLNLTVYRGSTSDRTAAVAFDVPSGFVAPAHLYLHPLAAENPAYYEVVGPEIVRVGVHPKVSLPFHGRNVFASAADLRRFDYVVVGDASTTTGLAAPYDEEETNQVSHLERLDKGLDLFEFWLKHQNTDLVTERNSEKKTLKPI